MDTEKLMELLGDIQHKMQRQEQESLELKDQVRRLEQHNKQLREHSVALRGECERLRGQVDALQKPPTSVLDRDSLSSSLQVQAWQRDLNRLENEVLTLQQENRQLRAEIGKRGRGGVGCCCLQWLQYLMSGDNESSEHPQQQQNTGTRGSNYVTSSSVAIQ